MTKNDQDGPTSSAVKKGYQPTQQDGPKQGGHQPTSYGAPVKPPSNPPDQGSGGKK